MKQFEAMGVSGVTQPCLIALESVLSGPAPVQKATVLTKNKNDHLIVLWQLLDWPFTGIIIKSGFGSGYSGEGGRGFSLALCMIHEQQIPIEHLEVKPTVFDHIDSGEFPSKWHRPVCESAIRIEMPIPAWIFAGHWELTLERRLWRAQSWQRWNSLIRGPYPGGYVDRFSWDVGDRLYRASKNLKPNPPPESCQQVGLMLRDAWIEFSRVVRTDIQDARKRIGKDDVKRVLDALSLPEGLATKSKKAHGAANALQHDRSAKPEAAQRCFNDTTEAMAEIIKARFPGQYDPRINGLIPPN